MGMLELQVSDENVYKKLKEYSIYHSDRTHVLLISDKFKEMIKENAISHYQEYNELGKIDNEIKGSKPILTIKGKNIMELVNASDSMMHFVGIRSASDPTIPIVYTSRVLKLIENDLIELDDKFQKLYYKLVYKNKINELVCANVKFSRIGRLTDYIEGELPITSLKFGSIDKKNPKTGESLATYKEVKINYRQLQLELIERYNTDGYIKCKICNSSSNQVVLIRFFTKVPLLRSILYKGATINVAASKIRENRDYDWVIDEPIILPEGLDYREDTTVTTIKRDIPADHFRNAYYEFVLRNRYGGERGE